MLSVLLIALFTALSGLNGVSGIRLGDHGAPLAPTPREVYDEVDPYDFMWDHVLGSAPLIMRGAASETPAFTHWSSEEYLRQKYGDVILRVEFGKQLAVSGGTQPTDRYFDYLGRLIDRGAP